MPNTGQGKGLLHLAIEGKQPEVCEWLFENTNLSLLDEDGRGSTCLDYLTDRRDIALFLGYVERFNLPLSKVKIQLEKFKSELAQRETNPGEILRKIRSRRRKARLDEVFKQAAISNQYDMDRNVLAKELEASIDQLCFPDKLWESKSQIRASMNALDVLQLKGNIHTYVGGLLKKCIYPQLLLRKSGFGIFERRRLKKDGSYFDRHPAFSSIKALIKNIRSTLNRVPSEQKFRPVKEELKSLIAYYQGYCNALCLAQTNQQREELKKAPVRLLTLDVSNKCQQRLMKSEAVGEVFKQKGEDQHGGRKVFSYGGVHYKLFPFSPGIEATVDNLNYQLVRGGSAPTKLLKIITPDGNHYPLIASKTVEGVELYDLIVQHKDLMKILDPVNFSQMVFLSLLINPQDGHFHNYIVKFKTDDQGRVSHGGLVCIDNDMAFAPTALKGVNREGKMIYFPYIRNGLYYLPQMDQPIDHEFRKQFLKLSPVQVILNWLSFLQKKNRDYQRYIDRGIFDPIEYVGDENVRRGEKKSCFKILEQSLNPGGLRLPIHLDPKTAKVIYRRIRIIQQLLKENPSLTHNQLFKALEPELHTHYAKVFKNNKGDILKSLVEIYQDSKAQLDRSGRPIVTDTYIEKMHEEESYHELSTVAFKTALAGKTPQTKRPPLVAEEWISAINWGHYGRQEGDHYLRGMGSIMNLTKLDLLNCEAFSYPLLLDGKMFKEIKMLTLRGRHCLTEKGIKNILNFRKSLKLCLDISTMTIPRKALRQLTETFGNRLELHCDQHVLLSEKFQSHFDALKTITVTGSQAMNFKSVIRLLKEKRQLGLILDVTKMPFQLAEIYPLAKELPDRFQLICKRASGKIATFYFGKRLNKPEELLDAFIQRHCLSHSFFRAIIELMEKYPPSKEVNINMRLPAERGGTFLHRAASAKNFLAYQWLIEAGIDPNIKDNQGRLAADLLNKGNQS